MTRTRRQIMSYYEPNYETIPSGDGDNTPTPYSVVSVVVVTVVVSVVGAVVGTEEAG